MTFCVILEMFWPLVAAFASVPAVAIALSISIRRREVRRMHQMRSSA